MAITLISPTTSAVAASQATSIAITQELLNSSLMATGLGTGETIVVKFSVDGGATWVDMYVSGAQATLTSTSNIFALPSVVRVSIDKPATAAPVGVYVSVTSKV